MRFLWDSDLELWYYFSNCRVILINCNICTRPFVDNNVKVAVIYLLIFCFKPYYVSFRLLIRNFIPIFFSILLTYRRLLKVILRTQIRLMIQCGSLGHDPLKWHLLALDLGSFSEKVNLWIICLFCISLNPFHPRKWSQILFHTTIFVVVL